MRKIITSFLILFFCFGLVPAEPVFAKITPNDPFYGNQWYLSKIKADNAWDKISESPDIIIAVIDSGIKIDHPDLRDNIWRNEKEIPGNKIDDDHNGFADDVNGWDFINNLPDPSPKFSDGWTEAGVSHGTMVAGIIAARGNNNEGVAGVTWRAKIMPLKVLNDKGEGKISDVVRAVDYAVSNGADIINFSFVSFDYSEALQAAISRANQAGVIIVAAAGNEQAAGEGYNIDKTPIYPACYDGQLGENLVIGVAATDALDQKAHFSSYGFHCVDIAAPGISFFNAVVPGGDRKNVNRYYDGYWSGTSMATPLVTATLALIEQANPELSQQEIVNILFASTDNINRLNANYLGQLGNGRLNVSQAVEMAKERLYSHVGRLIIAPATGNKELKITAANGDLINKFSLGNKYGSGSLGAGDVNNDGREEIVSGAAGRQEPTITIFNSAGKVLKKFLAFDKKFSGGVNIAVADLDDDGQAEIIAAPASSAAGQIKIFSFTGKLEAQFLAMDKKWIGGLNVAAGNLDGRGRQEIVISTGAGAEPQVKIFSAAGKLIGMFSPYEKKFRGGVNLAVANLDGRKDHNKAEIIVSPGAGREPLVKIFDHRASLKKQFLAYKKSWQGGVSVAAGDLNNDGEAEIALGAEPGAAPHVRIFDGNGGLLESFYAWEENFNGGVNIGIININN